MYITRVTNSIIPYVILDAIYEVSWRVVVLNDPLLFLRVLLPTTRDLLVELHFGLKRLFIFLSRGPLRHSGGSDFLSC